jgi:small-conductance mechanosensitive channel
MSSRPLLLDMKLRDKLILGALLLVVAAVVAGIWFTRETEPPVGKPSKTSVQAASPVNTEPLQTAIALRSLASTEQQQELANRALRLGDDAVDLAFSTALRDTFLHPAPQTPETIELAAKAKAAEDRIAQDQAWIAKLKAAAPATGPAGASHPDEGKRAAKPRPGPGDEQLSADELKQREDFAEARLTLDQDELADAQQDLMRAGGDRHATLQRMLAEHEATHQSLSAAESSLHPTDTKDKPPTMISRLAQWRELRATQQKLAAAEQTARTTVANLQRAHKDIEQQFAAETPPETPQVNGKLDPAAAAAATAAMRRRSRNARTLADYDKWIQNEQELAATYNQWSSLVSAQRRGVVHDLLQSLLAILGVVLLVLVADFFVTRFYLRLTPERKRLRSLRYLARFALQAVGVLFIIFIVFGVPGQLTTVLGLAGAGLTVALKDFIVAFFGWFVLMGKDGIRVGDWVEINGIGGEVLEIGLLRTILLETGAWADAGHPTGRKVTFVNSFAIEGHYFNFSTSGQWLWDTIEVLLPPGEDPYPVVDGIENIVIKQTESSCRQAEVEWQRVAGSQALRAFSARPSIDVRPTNIGVSISVRFITRAQERYELRSRLYRAVLELLHNRNVPHPEVATRAISPGMSD